MDSATYSFRAGSSLVREILPYFPFSFFSSSVAPFFPIFDQTREKIMVQFHIVHRTSYHYDQAVTENKNILRIYPYQTECQHVLDQTVRISGNPSVIETKDSFGNRMGMFTLHSPHTELIIESEIQIQNQACNKRATAEKASKSWEDLSLLARDTTFQLFLNPREFAPIPEIKEAVEHLMPQGKTPFEVAMDMTTYVYTHFAYRPGSTNVHTETLDVWKLKAGVCQDFAHVLIYLLRLAQLPARYVSGYICPNADGLIGDGATHAWVEVYIPQYGWLGVDPTNNCCAEEKYVSVAVGRDYKDIAPIKGEFTGQARTTLQVVVTVRYEEIAEPACI